MATVYQVFLPEEAALETTTFAQFVNNAGTDIPVTGMAFDAGDNLSEQCFWKFRAINYATGDPVPITIDIDWYADTATTGDVVWDVQFMSITPGIYGDLETNTLDIVEETTTTAASTTGQEMVRSTIIATHLGGMLRDDICWMVLRRDTTAANDDDMAGDAIVVLVTISYSDS